MVNSADHPCDFRDLPLFPVVQFIEQYEARLDSGRFSAMHLTVTGVRPEMFALGVRKMSPLAPA